MKINEGMEQDYKDYVAINSDDPYSQAVVTYTERWADLMEERIENGHKLEDIADATSSIADVEGITGFMYGCAAVALARFWIHGEQFRVWHNATFGVPANVKGTVNPAIMTINTGE